VRWMTRAVSARPSELAPGAQAAALRFGSELLEQAAARVAYASLHDADADATIKIERK